MEELDKLLAELDEYKKFQKNWDGYDGAVFSEQIVDFVKDFVKETFTTKYMIDACPAPDGSIDISFENVFNKINVSCYSSGNNSIIKHHMNKLSYVASVEGKDHLVELVKDIL